MEGFAFRAESLVQEEIEELVQQFFLLGAQAGQLDLPAAGREFLEAQVLVEEGDVLLQHGDLLISI